MVQQAERGFISAMAALLPAAVLFLEAGAVFAQEEQPAPATAIAAIQSAEAEGRAWPERPGTAIGGSTFRTNSWTGSADRVCVQIKYGHNTYRSGDFIIGGDFTHMATASRGMKLWWVPYKNGPTMDPLVVNGKPLSRGTAEPFRLVKNDIAIGGAILQPDYFFPTEFVFPDSGRWLITVSSGPNWGCFIMDVR